jgi:hypothetical protein
VAKRLYGLGVSKSHHITVQNIQIHWFKNGNNMFLRAFSTVQSVRKVFTFSSQMCLAVLSWSPVPPLITLGPRPGGAGFFHGVVGVKIAYAATETMMSRCPKAPPPK